MNFPKEKHDIQIRTYSLFLEMKIENGVISDSFVKSHSTLLVFLEAEVDGWTSRDFFKENAVEFFLS